MVVSRLTGEQEGSVAGEARSHSPLCMRQRLMRRYVIDVLVNAVGACPCSRNQTPTTTSSSSELAGLCLVTDKHEVDRLRKLLRMPSPNLRLRLRLPSRSFAPPKGHLIILLPATLFPQFVPPQPHRHAGGSFDETTRAG
jgi:hypothetical protein